MINTKKILEGIDAMFDEMEKNHGWIPEHKERVKDFLHSFAKELIGAVREDIEMVKKSPAYINLTTEWGQLDEDGISIAVSRQALEETITALSTIDKGLEDIIK